MQEKKIYTSPESLEFGVSTGDRMLNASLGDATINNYELYENEAE